MKCVVCIEIRARVKVTVLNAANFEFVGRQMKFRLEKIFVMVHEMLLCC